MNNYINSINSVAKQWLNFFHYARTKVNQKEKNVNYIERYSTKTPLLSSMSINSMTKSWSSSLILKYPASGLCKYPKYRLNNDGFME